MYTSTYVFIHLYIRSLTHSLIHSFIPAVDMLHLVSEEADLQTAASIIKILHCMGAAPISDVRWTDIYIRKPN